MFSVVFKSKTSKLCKELATAVADGFCPMTCGEVRTTNFKVTAAEIGVAIVFVVVLSITVLSDPCALTCLAVGGDESDDRTTSA